jgi:hypothetical protein
MLKCTQGGGFVSGTNCFTAIHPDTAIRYNYTNADVFLPKALGSAVKFPTMMIGPKVYAAGVWPNSQNYAAVSTVIDCSKSPSSASFRFAFYRSDIGPCIVDSAIQMQVCSKDGKPQNNQLYWNSKLQQMPNTAIWKASSCPVKAT